MTSIATQQIAVTPQRNEFYTFFRDGILSSYTREEAVLQVLLSVILLGGLVLLAINAFSHQFTIITISTTTLACVPVLVIVWWLIGHSHRVKWPRFGLFSITLAYVAAMTVILSVGSVGALTTPFPIIDYHLVKFDHWLGFDVTALMVWVNQYPSLMRILPIAYDSWYFQILLAPLLLALLNKRNEVNRYFMAVAICYIFGHLTYYFFPTIAPAGVMHSIYFAANQYDLVTRFYEIHQQLPITAFNGGMVAFPSYHVIFALLVLVSLRNIKILFYPMLILNVLLIFATMALGYHYLADVLGSFAIVTISLILVHLIYKKIIKNLA